MAQLMKEDRPLMSSDRLAKLEQPTIWIDAVIWTQTASVPRLPEWYGTLSATVGLSHRPAHGPPPPPGWPPLPAPPVPLPPVPAAPPPVPRPPVPAPPVPTMWPPLPV